MNKCFLRTARELSNVVCHHLVVPRHRRSMLGRRPFSVAGPMAWNALHDDLPRPVRPVAQCRQFPEEAKDASVSECTWTLSALEALRKFKTYLLTYLLRADLAALYSTSDPLTFKQKQNSSYGLFCFLSASLYVSKRGAY